MLQEMVEGVGNSAKSVLYDEVHTAIPGKIVSVQGAKAVVQPVGKYKTSDGSMMNYPQLSSVPLVMPISSSSGVGMAFPVRAGDSCLIIVSEIGLAAWRSGADAQGTLRFDLSNAVAIPGLLSFDPQAVTQANSTGSVVINGNLVVTGDVTVNGISFSSHKHTCSGAGSDSGPAKA